MKEIEIKVLKNELIDWRGIELFQPEGFKKQSKDQLEKLKRSIQKNGIVSSLIVWQPKNSKKIWAGDCHHRLKALKELESEGVKTPDKVPSDFVICENKKEFAKLILIWSSKYSDVTQDGYDNFIKLYNIEIDEINITDINVNGEQNESEYSAKIEPPIYEITGDKPELADLLNSKKAKKLISKINEAKIKDNEIKSFLIVAAQRHNIFSYSNIAEYYAHSCKEVQELMEESALIIIDYKKAIENGFTRLAKRFAKIVEENDG